MPRNKPPGKQNEHAPHRPCRLGDQTGKHQRIPTIRSRPNRRRQNPATERPNKGNRGHLRRHHAHQRGRISLPIPDQERGSPRPPQLSLPHSVQGKPTSQRLHGRLPVLQPIPRPRIHPPPRDGTYCGRVRWRVCGGVWAFTRGWRVSGGDRRCFVSYVSTVRYIVGCFPVVRSSSTNSFSFLPPIIPLSSLVLLQMVPPTRESA